MPKLIKKYELEGVPSDSLYQLCKEIFEQMNVKIVEEKSELEGEKQKRIIAGTISSMWGWGGVRLLVKISQDTGKAIFEFEGFINQLFASPLTSKMEDFLGRLKNGLKARYDYNFQYESLPRFLAIKGFQYTKADIVTDILIVGAVFVLVFGELLGISGIIAVLIFLAVGVFGYYLGRKYLFR